MSDVNTFTLMLHDALTPITLISGIGLLMLCMTARFMHCTNRIRQLVKKRSGEGIKNEPVIDNEIHIIYRRASLLRLGTFCLSLSALFAVILVTANILQTFTGISLDAFCGFMLILSILLIVASCIIFSLEIRLSLMALSMAIDHIKIPYTLKK